MVIIKKILKYIGLFLLAFAIYVVLYLAAAKIISSITVEKVAQEKEDVSIYILTNGVHTDLVLPVKSALIDWNDYFPYANTASKDTTPQFIGIGWGDKGFYLNTPTWGDLTFGTAFRAVFGLSTTAIHATYEPEIKEDSACFKITMSTAQYQQLIDYIKKSIVNDASGKPQFIPTTAIYGKYDAFYESVGSYSMFHTCNTWTNDGLKSCGQKACLWTPFQTGIFNQYKK